MLRLPLAALLLTGLNALAEGGAPDAGPTLTKAPALLKQVEAEFPAEALDAGVAGAVTLEVDISAEGKVTDARVVTAAGHGFDEAALEAVKKFEFSPAEVDHVPAPVRILYTYEFVWRPQVVETPVAPEDVVNFTGSLVERGTRDPLPNATVVVRSSKGDLESSGDAQGHFELGGVPKGQWPVIVTVPDHIRYEVTERFKPGVRTEVTYYVRKQRYGQFETVVRAQRERKDVSEVTLKQEEILLVPGTQGDAFKVVENLPGVARAPYNIGLLVVRGGAPWDTRVYVDDVMVPLLFHFGGLYSTYNAHLLKDLTFEPGNFGVEFGRSTGGLVRATSRTPGEEGIHGYVDLNLVDASFLVETPINSDWSIAASGRRSYIDVTLPLALKLFVPDVNQALSFTTAPRYYDYQLKAEYHPKNSPDRFTAQFFGSDDQLGLVLNNPAYLEGQSSFDTLIHYDRLMANWDHQFSNGVKLSSHNTAGIDRSTSSVGADIFFKVTGFPTASRDSLTWELPQLGLTLEAGADLFLLPFTYSAQAPPPFHLNQVPDPLLSRTLLFESKSEYTFEPGLFAEGVWKWDRVKLVPGVRVDFDSLMHKGWIDPRLNGFVDIGWDTLLKAGLGLFHQPPDYRRGELSPTFGNPDLLPEAASHYSVGVEHKFTEAIGLDCTLYYKQQFHLAQATLAGLPSTDNPGILPAYTSTGLGRSYGLEVLLRHQLTHNFFGWIAYSLSRSEITYFPGQVGYSLNPFDQTHNLVVIASYKLPRDFIVGVRVRYTTGPLDTPFINSLYDNNANLFYPIFKDLFSRRLPAFFELDARIDKRWVFDKWVLAVYADVQNVTNRQNVESTTYNYNYQQSQPLVGLPILPNIGVRAEL
jgi:TonB family protein